jgi:hypothetical protein
LDGVNVAINGTPAVVAFVSPTQLNVLAPDGIPAGLLELTVQNSLGWGQLPSNVAARPARPAQPGAAGAAWRDDHLLRHGFRPDESTGLGVSPVLGIRAFVEFGAGTSADRLSAGTGELHRVSGKRPLSDERGGARSEVVVSMGAEASPGGRYIPVKR